MAISSLSGSSLVVQGYSAEGPIQKRRKVKENFLPIPDELIYEIFKKCCAKEVVAFGSTCQLHGKLALEDLYKRCHLCIQRLAFFIEGVVFDRYSGLVVTEDAPLKYYNLAKKSISILLNNRLNVTPKEMDAMVEALIDTTSHDEVCECFVREILRIKTEREASRLYLTTETLDVLHSVITRIANPIKRCEQLIGFSEEYTFLDDPTQEDEEKAQGILEEAVTILKKEIIESDSKARLWLSIFEIYEKQEVDLSEEGMVAPGVQQTLKERIVILRELFYDIRDVYIKSKVLLKISHIYEDQINKEAAQSSLKETYQVAKLISDSNKKIQILFSISRVYGSLDFLKEAIDILEDILNFANTLLDERQKLNVLNQVASECKEYKGVEDAQILLEKVQASISS